MIRVFSSTLAEAAGMHIPPNFTSGNRVLLPERFLSELAAFPTPLNFELSVPNTAGVRLPIADRTFCGVLEFVTCPHSLTDLAPGLPATGVDEDCVIVPPWVSLHHKHIVALSSLMLGWPAVVLARCCSRC